MHLPQATSGSSELPLPPPPKRKCAADQYNPPYQKMAWNTLKQSINRSVNKVSVILRGCLFTMVREIIDKMRKKSVAGLETPLTQEKGVSQSL